MPVNIEQKNLERFSHLELFARQVVEGFITGMHKSPFHGFSVEFAEHRLYNKGESTRHIDWKLFARSERLFVKRYEEETNLRCQIVIDDSPSMLFPADVKNNDPEHLNKLGFAAYSAAALIHLLKGQSDACGLSLFSEDVHLQTPAKSSKAHLKYLYHELENLLNRPLGTLLKKSNTVESIHTIAESIHKRSLVIIFSDMFDSRHRSDEIFSALQHLKHNKHEVLLFHTVSEKQELNFDFENRPYTFIDMENGQEVKLNPASIKESYRKNMDTYLHELKLRCASLKIDFIEASIEEGFNKVLYAYLIKRQAMM